MESGSKGKKNRKRILESDSEDEKSSPKKSQTGKSSTKKSKSTKEETSKYFEVSKKDVKTLFGTCPVKRVEQPKIKKKETKDSQAEIHDIKWDDDDFSLPESIEIIENKKIERVNSGVESVAVNSSDSKDQPPVINYSKCHSLSPSPEREVDSPAKTPEVQTKISPIKNSSRDSPRRNKNSPNKNGPLKRKSQKSPLKVSPKKKILKLEEKKVTSPPKKALKDEPIFSLWVDKYKPTNLKQIIGQQGEKSNVNKLVHWLNNWFSNHSGKKKIPRPSPWAKDDTGAFFKAALLSGPPGIGKTTTTHLVCKELGMDVVEFNASDTRSKKSIKEEISEILKSTSLTSYASGGEEVSCKRVLVMDEVDGMAGNEDRGGVQELIQLIKSSRIPVICMCNDRNHPKIRSLANYCFDLRFSKPKVGQIKGAMMTVCFKEELKIKPDVLNDIIVNTNQDIRLILNYLSVLAAQDASNMTVTSKYIKIGPWDVLRKVFSEEEHKKMSIHDKCDLFFYDYNIAPLFVQENYLNVQPHSNASKTKSGKMQLFAKAAESLGFGDLVEKTIRTNNAWNLLPVQAVFSSYMPGEYLAGHVGGQINFPAWLGKNSRRGKLDRLCQEIQGHTRLKVSGSKEAINMDYSYALKDKVIKPLLRSGSDGIEESLGILREYSLLREDIESLTEITMWPGFEDPFASIESKVKAAFTRAYNKNPVMTPFGISAAVKKGRGGASSEEMEFGDDNLAEEDSDDESQDDITKDGMILPVKKKVIKDESKETKKEKGETSKRKPRGGGRGKPGKK